MSLTAQQKAHKDQARVRKALNKDPNVLAKMLVQAFNDNGKRIGKGITGVALAMDKKKSWLGTSLLKVLVGQGYLRPVAENGYTLTRKGQALRRSYLEKGIEIRTTQEGEGKTNSNLREMAG